MKAEQGDYFHTEGGGNLLAAGVLLALHAAMPRQLWHGSVMLIEWLVCTQVSPNSWASYSLVRIFVSFLFIFLYPKWIRIVFTSWQLRKSTTQNKRHPNILKTLETSSWVQMFAVTSCSHPAHRRLDPQLVRGFVALSVVTSRWHNQVFQSFPHCYNVRREALRISHLTLTEIQGRQQFETLGYIV